MRFFAPLFALTLALAPVSATHAHGTRVVEGAVDVEGRFEVATGHPEESGGTRAHGALPVALPTTRALGLFRAHDASRARRRPNKGGTCGGRRVRGRDLPRRVPPRLRDDTDDF